MCILPGPELMATSPLFITGAQPLGLVHLWAFVSVDQEQCNVNNLIYIVVKKLHVKMEPH